MDAGRYVDVVSFDKLTAEQLQAWQTIRCSRPEFVTPFFSTQFSASVHRSRGDVFVAVIYDADQIIGFLPFHRVKNVAYPVGRFFNDAHNIIAASDAGIDWIWLLEQIGVKAYDFHAMLGTSVEQLGAKELHRHSSIVLRDDW